MPRASCRGTCALTAIASSGSMEPAFQRGDLLFLTNDYADPLRVGEIIVFKIHGRDIPIVHRIIKLHDK
jgi:signal peptidase I